MFRIGGIVFAAIAAIVVLKSDAVGSGKDDLVAGMEQFAGIRFTEKLKGDYNDGDILQAVVTDRGKFGNLRISGRNVLNGDKVTVKLLDKSSSKIAIIDEKGKTGKEFHVGDFGKLTPVRAAGKTPLPGRTIGAPAMPQRVPPPSSLERLPPAGPVGAPGMPPRPLPPAKGVESPLQGR